MTLEEAQLHTNWCEIDVNRLSANARFFKSMIAPDVRLAIPVKANAYGHGILIAAEAFLQGGADWLCVHSLSEAKLLRDAGVSAPIHLVGPVPLEALGELDGLDLSLIIYCHATLERLIALGVNARVHLKVETGNHRQGVSGETCVELADKVRSAPSLTLEGACTHFSDIEDTTDHRFARGQVECFEAALKLLRAAGHEIPIRHVANTAATLLWSDLSYELVRVGIGGYGLWPSKETQIAALIAGRSSPQLSPAMTWKTRIAQVKSVPEGAYIGYGRTYRTTHASQIAVLPMGYFDGYDRKASNRGFVLCRGKRAPIVGRVCMNMTMIDVTHIDSVTAGDEIVLMGQQGGECVSAEDIAGWTGTINYEVVSRIGTHVPRVAVDRETSSIIDSAPYRLPKR